MELEKVKFEEIVQEIAIKSLIEALGKARSRYKTLNEDDFALVMGLSESQFKQLKEKSLGAILSENLMKAIDDHVAQGHSIEFKNRFNVFVHESTTRVNEETGEPFKKMSIKTRKELREKLNSHM